MAMTRQNVYSLGGDWADPILWYAKAVEAMLAKPIADPTSWRFYGAIHGIDPGAWTSMGYLKPTDPMPTPEVQDEYWNQCQHGTWYFLPWHRGYLLQFEANVRAVIVSLGGPSDWALPYWNYFNAGQNVLPPAFASKTWPGGPGVNPLYVEQRYGPTGISDVYVPPKSINLKAMGDTKFTGLANGGSKGFGGPNTGFTHGANTFGGVENQPHNMVHTQVGGQLNDNAPGLMSVPDTAALDPIFWLHHANIDRLWEVWNENPSTNVDPTDPKWLNGPASIGEQVFVVPLPNGQPYTYTPSDMVSLTALGYTYDDLSPQGQVHVGSGGHAAMQANNVELVGASQSALAIGAEALHVPVAMDPAGRKKVGANLTAKAEAGQADHVYLNLENIRGSQDASVYDVYVGVPVGSTPAEHPELLVESFSLFGVSKASLPDGEHGGQGLTVTIEITEEVKKLQLGAKLDVDSLHVWVVPAGGGAKATIGRISIYRQGA